VLICSSTKRILAMPHLRYVLAATVAACLPCGVAAAQPISAPASASAAAPPASQVQSAPAAYDRATPASATTTEPTTAVVTMTSDANGERHLIVSSPPVPDTPESRAKYGRPLSAAGRDTPPTGN
jgi:hypothetical protein